LQESFFRYLRKVEPIVSALYPKRVEVVAGLILRDQRLLVCQRHEHAAFPLKWELPGGKVERGESPLNALKRELKEELAIEMYRATEIFSHDHVYPGTIEVNLRFFRIDEYDGEPRNLLFQQITWMPIRDLLQLDFLEGDLPFIRELLSPKGAILLGFNRDKGPDKGNS
jgi:8-oxo-dGTP diphosphatase